LIYITVGLNSNLVLNYYQATGHAQHNKPGADVVCAAATCLLRTAAGILSQYKEIKVAYHAVEPGEMELNIVQLPEEKSERVKGVTDFLLQGLADLQLEYPKHISLTIKKN
jgi:uncharacterized protein YsxB (DUF464 family)